jgi:hypothetical protein
MKPVVGVFNSRGEAELGAARLDSTGIAKSRIRLLTPESTQQEIASVPTEEAEQPGMGMALGATVGGAIGLASGIELGGAVASLAIPGIGPVLAIGFAGGALGLIGGGAAGNALEKTIFVGLPEEELFVYEDALRQGRSVVIAMAENEGQAEAARSTLEESGVESIDRAREMWWIGLRDIEKEHYESSGGNFRDSERDFRAGFEAAQHPSYRENSYEESHDRLRERYGTGHETKAFRQGFERGRIYYQQTRKRSQE